MNPHHSLSSANAAANICAIAALLDIETQLAERPEGWLLTAACSEDMAVRMLAWLGIYAVVPQIDGILLMDFELERNAERIQNLLAAHQNLLNLAKGVHSFAERLLGKEDPLEVMHGSWKNAETPEDSLYAVPQSSANHTSYREFVDALLHLSRGWETPALLQGEMGEEATPILLVTTHNSSFSAAVAAHALMLLILIAYHESGMNGQAGLHYGQAGDAEGVWGTVVPADAFAEAGELFTLLAESMKTHPDATEPWVMTAAINALRERGEGPEPGRGM